MIEDLAASGVQGGGGSLPFGGVLQAAFGKHSLAGKQAHVGGPAKDACDGLDANAFAYGDDVAFASAPDLHTAAHEAAHLVQQDRGVQLSGGIDTPGDAHERHADAVADAVVSGGDAEAVLDEAPGGAGGGGGVVQRNTGGGATPPSAPQSGPQTGPGQAPASLQGSASGSAGRAGGGPGIEPGFEAEGRVSLEIEKVLEFGGRGPVSAEATFKLRPDAKARLKLASSPHPDDADQILLALEFHGEAGLDAEVEGQLSAEVYGCFPLTLRGALEGKARFVGALDVQKAVDKEAWNRTVQAISTLSTALPDALRAVRSGWRQLSAATDAFDAVIVSLQTLAQLLPEVDRIITALRNIANYATDVIAGVENTPDLMSGDPEAARSLEAGEGMRIMVDASADVQAEADASGGHDLLMGVGGSVGGSVRWHRELQLIGGEDHVTAVLTFVDEEGEREFIGGTMMGLSVGVSSDEKHSEGHRIEIQLPKDDQEAFEAAMEAITAVRSPEDLVNLTHLPSLQWDADTQGGITTLELSSRTTGTARRSSMMGSGRGHGILGGSSQGRSQSRARIDYTADEGDMLEVSVVAGKNDAMGINLRESRVGGFILDELSDAGLDLSRYVPDDVSFDLSTLKWEFDGSACVLPAETNRLANALTDASDAISWAGGPKDLEAFAARAARDDNADWDRIGRQSIDGMDALEAWYELGDVLASVHAQRGQETISVRGRNVSLRVREQGTTQPLMLDGQPYLPAGAREEWAAFTIAREIGAFVAGASGSADAYRSALLRVRSGYEFQPMEGGEELGVEFDKAIGLDGGEWIELETRTGELLRQLDAASSAAEARARSEQEVALDNDLDPALQSDVHAHLDKLGGVEDDIHANEEWIARNADEEYEIAVGRRIYTVASMLGFLQRQRTDLVLELERYGSAHEGDVHTTSVLLHDLQTGWRGGYSETEHGSSDRGPSDLLRNQAGRVANNLAAVRNALSAAIARFEEEQTYATARQPELLFHRYRPLWRDFKRLVRAGAGGEDQPPANCSPEVWSAAFRFPSALRDRYVRISEQFHHIGVDFTATGAARARLRDEEFIHEEQTEQTLLDLPPMPQPNPNYFAEDFPRPPGCHDQQEGDRRWRNRSDVRWRDIDNDRATWGFTAAGTEAVYAWGESISWYLVYAPDQIAGQVFVIQAHADEQDDEAYNVQLAYRRALAIRQLLVEIGVPPAILRVESFGESTPLVGGVEDATEEELDDKAEGLGIDIAGPPWSTYDRQQKEDHLHQINRRAELAHAEVGQEAILQTITTALDHDAAMADGATTPSLDDGELERAVMDGAADLRFGRASIEGSGQDELTLSAHVEAIGGLPTSYFMTFSESQRSRLWQGVGGLLRSIGARVILDDRGPYRADEVTRGSMDDKWGPEWRVRIVSTTPEGSALLARSEKDGVGVEIAADGRGWPGVGQTASSLGDAEPTEAWWEDLPESEVEGMARRAWRRENTLINWVAGEGDPTTLDADHHIDWYLERADRELRNQLIRFSRENNLLWDESGSYRTWWERVAMPTVDHVAEEELEQAADDADWRIRYGWYSPDFDGVPTHPRLQWMFAASARDLARGWVEAEGVDELYDRMNDRDRDTLRRHLPTTALLFPSDEDIAHATEATAESLIAGGELTASATTKAST